MSIGAALTLNEPAVTDGVGAMADVAVDGGTLACLRLGSGPQLVMLHGWTLDHRSWTPQHPLAGSHQLILPDRRGFGRSSAAASPDSEWRDIDRLVGDDRFVLLGLSQGAGVALDYARRQPHRLMGLILVGTPLHGIVPNGGGEPAIPRGDYADLVRAGRIDAVRSQWRRHPLTRVTPSAQPLLDAILADYDGRDLIGANAALQFAADDIAQLPMPVLAIAGADDTAWRRQVAAWIAATAPKGCHARIDGAGHLCNLDAPDTFNAIVADFLSSLPC
ncbi:alpha/beta fold hydrolase [Sphingomonas sp. CJ99]